VRAVCRGAVSSRVVSRFVTTAPQHARSSGAHAHRRSQRHHWLNVPHCPPPAWRLGGWERALHEAGGGSVLRCCAALRTDALSRRVRAQCSHSRRPSPPAPCGARCGARRGVQTLLSRAGKCHCAPRRGGAPAPWRDASTKARRSAHHVCRTARAEEAEEARYEPVMHACIVRLPSGSWHAATGMPRIPHRHAARRRARRLMRRELSAKHAFRRFASYDSSQRGRLPAPCGAPRRC